MNNFFNSIVREIMIAIALKALTDNLPSFSKAHLNKMGERFNRRYNLQFAIGMGNLFCLIIKNPDAKRRGMFLNGLWQAYAAIEQ